MDAKPITTSEVARIAREAEEEGYPYLFSVVIAVYNAEEYLEETVDSVVNQTIGLSHTQVILVNDGSVDDSLRICQELERRFPDNVVVLSQDNAGVSAARNAGLSRASGKYVNFLDSDDKWSHDAFGWALSFFDGHPDVNVAASRYVLFDAKTGDHRLNYKFDTTRVIDLTSEYDAPQLSGSTCFFHQPAVSGRAFCRELAVSEDTRFVNEILLDELSYGVMSEPTYYYRQRQSRDSAIDTMKERKSWYFDTPEKCYRRLFEASKAKHGAVLPFIQYTVMYDLQWRIRAKAPETLSAAEMERYRTVLEGLLAEIDDHIIAEQRTISIDQVAFAVTLKYGTDMDDVLDHLFTEGDMLATHITGRDGNVHEVMLRPMSALSTKLTVQSITLENGSAVLRGFVTSFRFRPRDVALSMSANNRALPVETFITDVKPLQNPFDDGIVGKTGFRCAIPLHEDEEVLVKTTAALLGNEPFKMRYRFTEDSGFERDPAVGDFLLASNLFMCVAAPHALVVRRFADAFDPAAIERTAALARAYRADAP